jgi:O-antigen ligase
VAVYLIVIHSYRFDLGQAAIVAAFIGLLIEGRGLRLPPGFLWCILFFVWAGISTVSSDLTTPETTQMLWTYGKVLLISILIASVLRDASQVSGFLVFWLACFAFWPVRGTLLNAAMGIGEFGRYAWNFSFRNPNDLAGMVLLMLGLTLAATKSGTSKHLRLVAMAGTGLLTLIIFLTQSRGAFLGVMVFGLLALTGRHRRLRSLLGTGAVAALVLVAAPSSVWERIGGLKNVTSTSTLYEADDEGSAAARYSIWRVALNISRDHPVTGIGFGSYREAHFEYSGLGGVHPAAVGRKDTHSAYLNALAETGYPGFIALLGFVISFGAFLWKAGRRLAPHSPRRAEQFRYLLAAWVAFWVSAVFGSFHRIVFPYLFAGFATALAAQYGVLGAPLASRRRQPQPAAAAPATTLASSTNPG